MFTANDMIKGSRLSWFGGHRHDHVGYHQTKQVGFHDHVVRCKA